MDAARRWVRQVRLSARFRRDPVGAALWSCWEGPLALVLWTGGLDAEHARRAFRWACTTGHLDVALWLVGRFGWAACAARSDDDYAFRAACGTGRLWLARWLAAHGVDSARAADNQALRQACGNGHLAVARWLVTRFGLGAGDAESAVALASAHGRVDVVRWLVDDVGVDRPAVRRNRSFSRACWMGRVDLAKYLWARFSLGPDDVACARALPTPSWPPNFYPEVDRWLASLTFE